MKLSREKQNTLINIAEWTIQDYLLQGKRAELPDRFAIDEELKSKRGVFISVYVNNKLRGCIGTFSESESIYKNVRLMSFQAAFEDTRFKPVTMKDISGLAVEISILSPRTSINGPEEIEIGRHGIYMIHGIRRATLLPQVAVEHHFSAIEFLECCAKNKLGLTKDSWKDAELSVYEAFVFR